jgi:glycerol-3-phosphate dehydrogenase
MNRTEMLQRLRSGDAWDVAIIGGGATGLGVAVDAATRGYRTLLIEAHDFAKATSSRSTKLVHGGVRYLEQGDIPLVLEALRERGLLHRNAPHLVHHLSFIVPRYKWWEGPFFGLGLKMYDLLAGRLNLEKSRLLDRDETHALIPNIEPEHLLGGVEYFDGQFDDARLAFTLAQTAADHGACLLNYVRATDLLKRNGLVCGLHAEDTETGETFEISARVVVNATGIFADAIRAMDEADAPAAVQPSQGVHLVLDREFLQGDSAIMVPHTDDGRVLFVIPWHDRVLVGTTDTPMKMPDLEPRALEEEIGFILRNASRYLARDPQRGDIRSVFAGQRPLVRPPRSDGSSTKQISRNHEVLISDGGLVTIVGGKWTTYRKMAEDALNHAALIGELPERKCVTETLQLHGWTSPHAPARDEAVAVYGSDARHIARLIEQDPNLAEPLAAGLPYQLAHVAWAARHEMARSVEDVLARRTRVLFLDAQAAMDAAPAAATVLAKELGRPPEWAAAQVTEFRKLAAGYLLPG